MLTRIKKPKIVSKIWRLNHLYKIVNKKGITITFKLNKVQKELHEIQKQYHRIIILKARQLGMSTYKIIEGLDRALFYKNQNCIITAHNQDKLKELFEKAKYAYDNLPERIQLSDGRIWIKPSAHYNNANELFFKDINSKIKVTLDSRSTTVTNLHITELAFKEKAKEMWTGTMPSVPVNAPMTVETTANGVGNFFHQLWVKYQDNTGGFRCLFFPWYDDPEYVSDTTYEDLAPELKHLLEIKINGKSLSQKQLNWYMDKYEELDDDVFQEYPSTPEEAFLSTGKPFFDVNKVKNLETPEYTKDSEIELLRIYKEPTNKCLYGVDTAGGGVEGDYSVIVVRDFITLDILACYYGHIEPDQLCDVIDRLQKLGYYGLIGIEANNTGFATITEAKNRDWIYSAYSRKILDEKTKKTTKKVGWRTDSKTRPIMLSEYRKMVRKGLLPNIDNRIKAEMPTFVKNKNGKPEALEGYHDDGIMADSICLQMREQDQILGIM